jgi:hypothetical protein
MNFILNFQIFLLDQKNVINIYKTKNKQKRVLTMPI